MFMQHKHGFSDSCVQDFFFKLMMLIFFILWNRMVYITNILSQRQRVVFANFFFCLDSATQIQKNVNILS